METKTLDLTRATTEVARVVAGVRDDQLTAPTPDEGTSVAGLLEHLVGLTLAFRLAAEKQPAPGGASFSAEDLAPDWRERLPAQLDALAEAWRDPAAWEGTTEAGGVRMPAGAMGVVALDEVVVHGWDLAVATGQPYSVDPADARVCLDFASDFGRGDPEARRGMYGPVVPVPDDAPVLDRLLGQTGRDPAWTPPA
ncbi:TIGR03086 family metal-binding protein [Geodermatophilus sp. YIM 151500]|uniref:TIGR03086 family metal-binding protein n=1 Tax=Geodermatophilus sp. YIM 151500 TaxID=2984531 RepID=UPI0021E4DA37|nr:TIGR03086 family metal-binding protein [Geodermatophilus sp. YIM 151500]MCV2488212.1 TIGR03086 family metal-binding protein [Geodermatophilus sp. YIM 151500]